jgi:hypothetical protein
MELSEREIRERETERLIEEIRTVASATTNPSGAYGTSAYGAGAYGGHWWNHPSEFLDGQTPLDAMRAGDEAAVRGWVAWCYKRTEESVQRHRADPEYMARIDRKAAELRAARTAPASA